LYNFIANQEAFLQQDPHHTGKLMKTVLNQHQKSQSQKRNFHSVEVRNPEIFQDRLAEFS